MNTSLHQRHAMSAAALITQQQSLQLSLIIGGEEALTGLIAAIIGSGCVEHDSIVAEARSMGAGEHAAAISKALYRYEGPPEVGQLWERHPDGCFSLN